MCASTSASSPASGTGPRRGPRRRGITPPPTPLKTNMAANRVTVPSNHVVRGPFVRSLMVRRPSSVFPSSVVRCPVGPCSRPANTPKVEIAQDPIHPQVETGRDSSIPRLQKSRPVATCLDSPRPVSTEILSSLILPDLAASVATVVHTSVHPSWAWRRLDRPPLATLND
jgi:hypothetical protein